MSNTIPTPPLSDSVFSAHAKEQCAARQISETDILNVLALPEAVLPQRDNCVAVHGIITTSCGKPYLLRIIVNTERKPPLIVTAYRTSNLAKYRKLLPHENHL